MKPIVTAATFALALTGSCNYALAGPSELDWLLGCWTSEDGSGREVWVRESDGQLIGFGVAMNDGRLVFHEVLSIRSDESGFHYTSHPVGQASATFTAAGVDGLEVSFTNPGHDYPQRIDYHLDGTELSATISLMDGSKANQFVMVRCK